MLIKFPKNSYFKKPFKENLSVGTVIKFKTSKTFTSKLSHQLVVKYEVLWKFEKGEHFSFDFILLRQIP